MQLQYKVGSYLLTKVNEGYIVERIGKDDRGKYLGQVPFQIGRSNSGGLALFRNPKEAKMYKAHLSLPGNQKSWDEGIRLNSIDDLIETLKKG